MPKFLCVYTVNKIDVITGFNRIAELISFLESLGDNKNSLNPRVFLDIGEHKYREIVFLEK